jgi:hypothetical protein
MRYSLLLFTFFLSLQLKVKAQDSRIIPLKSDESRAKFYHEATSLFRTSSEGDTLKGLPFFDDFTNTYGIPDSERWLISGGTYINNNFAVNPPGFNVATFDGLDAEGRPYEMEQNLSGQTDVLTSRPIDLSGYTVEDSLYLSFWWQAGGLGESPDPDENDRLVLEFKDPFVKEKWRTIWEKRSDSSGFNPEMIGFKGSQLEQYLYNGFQFRFKAYGNRTEMSDVWHVDYVYFDKNRTIKDSSIKDLAILSAPQTILNSYTSVPYKHLSAISDSQLKPSLSIKVKNYFPRGSRENTIVNDDTKPNLLIDEFTGMVLDTFSADEVVFSPIPLHPDPLPETVKEISWMLDYSKLKSLDQPLKLKYYYNQNFSDFSKDTVTFLANNKIVDSTILYNYYAYDDGTAEAVHGISYEGDIAVKFNAPITDSIIGVKINFVPIKIDHTGRRITIKLFNSITEGKGDEELIASKDEEVFYPGINKFVTYHFDKPVAVNGDFYIGFHQYSIDDFIDVGYDLNRKSSDKIFYKKSGAWKAFEAPRAEGSLLIRPVFGGSHYQLVAGNKDLSNNQLNNIELYPNPASENINLFGEFTIAEILDISGNVVKRQDFSGAGESKVLNVADLEPGMYFIKFTGDKTAGIRKIVISR